MDVAAVLFDMDGVIVDSERYWHEEERTILAEAVPDQDVPLEDITGMNVLDQYDHLASQYDVAVSRDAYFDLYDSRADAIYGERVVLMEGFHDLVGAIRARGVRTALASSSFRRWIELVLARFDLRDLFDVIVSAEDIDGPSKPAPGIYRHAASELGVDPGQCVVVEDSGNGVAAAKEAGMYCIGFDRGGADLSQADIVVQDPEALRDRLEALLPAPATT